MDPVLHLSLPVRDLDEARTFYVEALGCEPGRVRDDFVDVWFFGMQLTLQDRPDEIVGLADAGVRHFGVTLGADELSALLTRVQSHDVTWVVEPSTQYAGTPREQTKAKIADPSGNVIELKTYPYPTTMLPVRDRDRSLTHEG